MTITKPEAVRLKGSRIRGVTVKTKAICLRCKTQIKRIPGGWECTFCEIPTTTYDGAWILEQRARRVLGAGGLTTTPVSRKAEGSTVAVAPPRSVETPTPQETSL